MFINGAKSDVLHLHFYLCFSLDVTSFISITYGYCNPPFAGNPEVSKTLTTRLFIACYWFMIITFVATYTGNMVAFMTVKTVHLPINTLEELAANPAFKAGPYEGGTALDIFKVAYPHIEPGHTEQLTNRHKFTKTLLFLL